MRRIFAIAAACTLAAFVATGCAQTSQGSSSQASQGSSSQSSKMVYSESGSPLSKVVSGEQLEALEGTGDKEPVAVGCEKATEGGQHAGFLYGPEGVKALREYLSSIQVGGQSDVSYSDADTYYIFYYPEGNEVFFQFNPDQVSVEGVFRKIVYSDKLELEFPGDDTYLASDPPSQDIKEFFSLIDAKTPVQATVSGPQGTVTLTDPEGIEDLEDQFRGLNLTTAVNGKELDRIVSQKSLQETTYEFSFQDGETHSFLFKGDYLCVDFPDGLGKWGYLVSQMPTAQ